MPEQEQIEQEKQSLIEETRKLMLDCVYIETDADIADASREKSNTFLTTMGFLNEGNYQSARKWILSSKHLLETEKDSTEKNHPWIPAGFRRIGGIAEKNWIEMRLKELPGEIAKHDEILSKIDRLEELSK